VKESLSEKNAGFTMVEVVVMLVIITAVSATVLVGFGSTRESASLNRSSRELALAIRRAQNMSLAVTQVETSAGPKIPPAVGIRLMQGGETYFLFADLARDNKYDGGGDVKIPRDGDLPFERGVRIKSLVYYTDAGRRETVSTAHIIFAAPEAAIMLSDINGAPLGQLMEAELGVPSGQLTKTITIRISGQIGIK
jgi:type II secretory pathway pseudopilin PulG